ncbi:MAG: iron-sulfur cluster assembly accessory protein [Pseudomonadota bacterium]
MSNNIANISVTDSANAHIRRQLDLTQANYLRLGVKESGCNGFMYMLDFLDTPTAEDACIDFANGVSICVSQQDLDMVSGTEVDMITEGLNSALVFKNPKATSYCGCGESFAVGGEPAANDTNLDPDDLATNVGQG